MRGIALSGSGSIDRHTNECVSLLRWSLSNKSRFWTRAQGIAWCGRVFSQPVLFPIVICSRGVIFQLAPPLFYNETHTHAEYWLTDRATHTQQNLIPLSSFPHHTVLFVSTHTLSFPGARRRHKALVCERWPQAANTLAAMWYAQKPYCASEGGWQSDFPFASRLTWEIHKIDFNNENCAIVARPVNETYFVMKVVAVHEKPQW